jgi:hypothetical protein
MSAYLVPLLTAAFAFAVGFWVGRRGRQVKTWDTIARRITPEQCRLLEIERNSVVSMLQLRQECEGFITVTKRILAAWQQLEERMDLLTAFPTPLTPEQEAELGRLTHECLDTSAVMGQLSRFTDEVWAQFRQERDYAQYLRDQND